MKREDKLEKSLKLIVKTSFIVFIGIIISKILAYTYRIIIARYYGPEVYGLFTLALTITSFFLTIAAFGLSDGLLRFIPLLRARKKQDEITYLIEKTRKFYIIVGLIFTVLLFFFSEFISVNIFHNSSLAIFLKIMSINIFISLLLNIYLISLRAYEKINWYSGIFNIFQNVARLTLLVVLILLGLNSKGSVIVWSWVLASFLTLIFTYSVCRFKIKEIFKKYEKQDYSELNREFFNYSWPLMFYSIISLFLYWVDTFSIGYYKSAVEVGFYNAAVPIALLLGMTSEIFLQLFFPLITKEYARKNYKLIEQLSKQVTKWIFIVALPIFILIFCFPGAALNILFGSNYIVAENALRILAIGTFISALFAVCNQLISMIGKSKLILFNISCSALINLILNSIFVPLPKIWFIDNSKGLIGAATATVISIIIFNLLFIFQTKKYLSFIPLRRKMINSLIAALISTSLLFYLRTIYTSNNLFVLGILFLFFLLVYILLLFAFRSFDENDKNIIKSIKRRLPNLKKI